jgi:YbbR domain-containing protein
MRKLLSENLGLKISAVLLSSLLWFFVTSRGQSEMSLEITPEFKNVPAALGIVNNSVKTVVVTIRGQERLMKNVKPSDVRVFVDLGKAKKGEGTYFLNTNDIKLPYAMTVTNVSPISLRIRLDETISKAVTVVPAITGAPEKGFYVKSVVVEPRSVVIQGLKNEVRKTNELRTEALDISGLKETTTQELNIDTSGINVKTEVNAVKVIVEIAGRKR